MQTRSDIEPEGKVTMKKKEIPLRGTLLAQWEINDRLSCLGKGQA